MKKRDLIKHIESFKNVEYIGEGGDHTLYKNKDGKKQIGAIPRHNEISPGTVRQICSKLEIKKPSKK